jgi:hypothetical protein
MSVRCAIIGIAWLACACMGGDAGGDSRGGGSGDSEPASGTAERWLFDTIPGGDLVHADDSESDLVRRLGARNVRADTVWLPEGAFAIGTVLYPGDSARRVDITWTDTIARARPEFIRVSRGSAWRVAPGAGIGTSLEELEELNGGPFEMTGFGWDYAGTVIGWSGGRLDSLWSDRVIVRLAPADDAPAELEGQVLGDRDYPSEHPAMQSLNPTVYEILIRPR